MIQIDYKFTVDNFMDAFAKARRYSRSHSSLYWQVAVLSSFLLGLVVFLILKDSVSSKTLLGLFVFVGGLGGNHFLGEWFNNYAVRLNFRKQFPNREFVDVYVTVDESGIQSMQDGVTVKYPWDHISQAVVAGGDVEIYGQHSLLTIVRKNGFQNDGARQQLIAEINKYAHGQKHNGA